jgi:2-C-methyl-D-erythritol 4-phosphate cytidylyltransferase/2-C-methyl-D-erythritol 2,4-cyclodiphosphate synthase
LSAEPQPVAKTAALIVAAGRGLRAGSAHDPKQYRLIGGRPVLARTLDLFLSHPAIDRVLVVIGKGDEARYRASVPEDPHLLQPVLGGDDRQESVRRGLLALAGDPPDRVLIHDAVRPFASPALVSRVVAALDHERAVVPALPITATLKAVLDGRVTATVPRDELQAAETPQGFRFAAILAAHERAATDGLTFTDDAAVAEWAGIGVHVVPGEVGNVKLTTAADLDAADRRLAADAALVLDETRVATGYDVHAFGAGDHVFLGGIAIPHDRGLIGHSDADVVLHALTDAILGALAEGDIGVHFPPSDAAWKGASSDRFLRFAANRVATRHGRIAHLNVALVAEAPRIGPYRDRMRERIAAICGISVDRIAVTATTNEGLGFIGRGEGIAAIATATIRLPFGDAS